MKSPLRFSHRLAAAGLAALLAYVAVAGLRAAGGPPPPPGYPADGSPPAPPVPATPAGWRQSLAQHRGGLVITGGRIVLDDGQTQPATLGNVVDVIRHLFPRQNIIFTGDPGLLLNNVTLNWSGKDLRQLDATLEALAASTGSLFTMTKSWPTDNSAYVGESNDTGLVWDSTTYVIARAGPKSEPPAPRHVATFNLSGLFGPKLNVTPEPHPNPETSAADLLKEHQLKIRAQVNEIETIVMETLSALSPSTKDNPTFRFHDGANLLIVIGSDDAIDVTHKIVTAMGGRAVIGSNAGLTAGTLTNDPWGNAYESAYPDSGPGLSDPIAYKQALAAEDRVMRKASSSHPITGDLEFKLGQTAMKQSIVLLLGQTKVLTLGDIIGQITATQQPDGAILYKMSFQRGSGKSTEVLGAPAAMAKPGEAFGMTINDLSVSFIPTPVASPPTPKP